MTFHFQNVYIEETSTVCGPYEKQGPLRRYFDQCYDDLSIGEDSWEKSEIRLVRDAIDILFRKTETSKEKVDVVVGGDLLNQITASTYGIDCGKSFVGVYGACSTCVLELILSSCLIDSHHINNALCVVSSHNMSSEKQFRYPTEYGIPRKNSSTFTATGGACALLSHSKSGVRIDCATLGKMIDMGQNDPNDMGRVMAPSVIDTITKHFKETGRKVTDYDLILTGDLGLYGQEIVKDYLRSYSDIYLDDSYQDCGVLLYDLKKQKNIKAGGSGPVCSALVVYSYIYSLMKRKKLKRVLFLATGALFSPTMIHQGNNIKSICHAISLEVL